MFMYKDLQSPPPPPSKKKKASGVALFIHYLYPSFSLIFSWFLIVQFIQYLILFILFDFKT